MYIENFKEMIPPRIIGVQIINDVVIFMDPCVARIDASKHQNSIFIRSELIVNIYQPYHKDLWQGIENYHHQYTNENTDFNAKRGYMGFILYSGDTKYILENMYWRIINSHLSENEQLSEDELNEIGIT